MECNQLHSPSKSYTQRSKSYGAFDGFKIKRLKQHSNAKIRKYSWREGFC